MKSRPPTRQSPLENGPDKENVPAAVSDGSSAGIQSVETKAKFSAGTRGSKFSPDVEKVQKLQ